MGTEVAKVGGVGLAALAKGLKRTRNSTPSFGGKQFLKFGKDGEWTVGKGSREAMNERIAVLNLPSLKAGYVCWTDYPKSEKKKNERLGEEMALAVLGGVDPTELPDLGWEWKQQQSIEGRFTDKDQKEFVYTTSSLGGLEALDGVLEAAMARIELQGEERFINPMVELQDDWYEHSEWGKTYKPVLEIVGWADEDGVPEGEDAPAQKSIEQDDEEEGDSEPDKEADEPPVRRRRR